MHRRHQNNVMRVVFRHKSLGIYRHTIHVITVTFLRFLRFIENRNKKIQQS